jgi:hypothetical protein
MFLKEKKVISKEQKYFWKNSIWKIDLVSYSGLQPTAENTFGSQSSDLLPTLLNG